LFFGDEVQMNGEVAYVRAL